MFGEPSAVSRPGRKSLVREYAEAIVVAMLLALCDPGVCRPGLQDSLRLDDSHVVDRGSYPGQQAVLRHSMAQPVQVSAAFPPVNCYASQALIEFGKPQRGDIIVFRFPEDEEKDFIKRIVGLQAIPSNFAIKLCW